MSTTVFTEPPNATGAAERLQATMCATRVSFVWLGTRKTLSSSQKAQAAESFGAAGEYLSAGKKLLDTKHPRFQAVNGLKGRIRKYWTAISLPYPEPGIRLIRRESVEPFQKQLRHFDEELQQAVEQLDDEYADLREAARQRLGELYSPTDYPDSLEGLFHVGWEFPNVEPPRYLRQLNPELYEQETRRVQARFDEAVQLAEQAFVDELSQLVAHLTERLSGHEDGKRKVFRDTAVGNLQEFFERFRLLNVRSNDQLDDLVDQCQQIVTGVAPQQLRSSDTLRQQVATKLSGVQSVLDGLLVDRPRRQIIRTPK